MKSPYPKAILCLSILALCCGSLLQAQKEAPEADLKFVLDRYLESMGGRANLQQITSLRLSGYISFANGSKQQITVLKKKPNLVRIILDTGSIRIVQAYDGKVAWFSQESGNNVFHDRMRGNLAEEFIRESPIANVLIITSPNTSTKLGEDVDLGFTSCYQIISSFPDGSKVIYWLEKETFLERRILYYAVDGQLVSELIPSDFEPIEGVLFSKKVIRKLDGKVVSTLEFPDIEINMGILDSAFSPPVELPSN